MGDAWICTTCGAAINAHDGFVEVVNVDGSLGDVGGYPCAPSPNHGEPRNRFVVYHSKCDPYPDSGQGYVIDLGRARTPEDWMAWLNHMSEKSWLGRSDMARGVLFWFRGRGLSVYDYA